MKGIYATCFVVLLALIIKTPEINGNVAWKRWWESDGSNNLETSTTDSNSQDENQKSTTSVIPEKRGWSFWRPWRKTKAFKNLETSTTESVSQDENVNSIDTTAFITTDDEKVPEVNSTKEITTTPDYYEEEDDQSDIQNDTTPASDDLNEMNIKTTTDSYDATSFEIVNYEIPEYKITKNVELLEDPKADEQKTYIQFLDKSGTVYVCNRHKNLQTLNTEKGVETVTDYVIDHDSENEYPKDLHPRVQVINNVNYVDPFSLRPPQYSSYSPQFQDFGSMYPLPYSSYPPQPQVFSYSWPPYYPSYSPQSKDFGYMYPLPYSSYPPQPQDFSYSWTPEYQSYPSQSQDFGNLSPSPYLSNAPQPQDFSYSWTPEYPSYPSQSQDFGNLSPSPYTSNTRQSQDFSYSWTPEYPSYPSQSQDLSYLSQPEQPYLVCQCPEHELPKDGGFQYQRPQRSQHIEFMEYKPQLLQSPSSTKFTGWLSA